MKLPQLGGGKEWKGQRGGGEEGRGKGQGASRGGGMEEWGRGVVERHKGHAGQGIIC